MIDQTRLLENGLTTFEHKKVGNTLHPIAGGELRIGFGVDLQDEGLTRHISGGARNFWSRGSAGTTPAGPEVNEDGYGGVLDDIVKGGGVNGKRLGERGKLGFASSTFAAGT
jgi:hypothetical protein